MGAKQGWIVGVGEIEGDSIIVDDALVTSGVRFGPRFDPDDVQRTTIGSRVFRRQTCDTGTMTCTSTIPEFGSGSLNVERITGVEGLACN